MTTGGDYWVTGDTRSSLLSGRRSGRSEGVMVGEPSDWLATAVATVHLAACARRRPSRKAWVDTPTTWWPGKRPWT